MMNFHNIFLDFSDGRFSNIFAEASSMNNELDLQSTCSAFACLVEAKGIAAEIAKKESLAYVTNLGPSGCWSWF
jgi:hypothetical protein